MNRAGEDLRISKGRETYARIVDVATKLFTEKGYANTSTEEIVRATGVTRGAFYHHFSSKEALFLAVFEGVQIKIRDHLVRELSLVPDPWEKLLRGNYLFLKSYIDPKLRRIISRDAPSVLDWEVYRETDAKCSMDLLKVVVKQLMEEEKIDTRQIDAVVHGITGAVNELALWVAEAKDCKCALLDAEKVLNAMCHGLVKDHKSHCSSSGRTVAGKR